LREAFQSQGISFVEWHLGQGGSFDLSAIPPEGVFLLENECFFTYKRA